MLRFLRSKYVLCNFMHDYMNTYCAIGMQHNSLHILIAQFDVVWSFPVLLVTSCSTGTGLVDNLGSCGRHPYIHRNRKE